MKIKTFTLLTLITLSQVSFINSKNINFISKANDNPYAPFSDQATTYSGKTFDLVDQNNNKSSGGGAGTAVAYIQIFDNANGDYLNHINSIGTSTQMLQISYNNLTGSADSIAHFYPSLSNIKRKETYYMTFGDSVNSTSMSGFTGDGSFALLTSENALSSNFVGWSTINNPSNVQQTEFTHYDPTSVFPYIVPYTEDESMFSMSDVNNDGELTFTIKVNNWTDDGVTDYLQQEEVIGTTFINEAEQDDYLQYEQYEAHLTNHTDTSYTYKVSGLNPTIPYSFYSINYTGITRGDSQYLPDFDLTLNADLLIPPTLTVTNKDAASVDTEATKPFEITRVGDRTIKFNLKITDPKNNYLDYLKKRDNTIDITLINLDSGNTISRDAKFKDAKGETFTFKVSGLSRKTNYEFVSLDNTNLLVNGVVDEEILVQNDLGISPEDATFKTENDNVLIIMMSILGFIILIAIILGLTYYFMSENKKAQMKKSLKGYFSKSN